jgi:hypothetical protein
VLATHRRALQVDRENGVPIFLRRVHDAGHRQPIRGRIPDARVVEQDVEGSELVHGGTDHLRHVLLTGHVGPQRNRLSARITYFFRRLLCSLLVDVGHDEPCAFLGKQTRRGLPLPPRGSRDHGYLTV